MFIIGAELRLPLGARKQLTAATSIGLLSVLIPMALGIGAGFYLHSYLAPPGVELWPFTLFLATALSVTAFPVMARILKDRHMTQTHIGRLALTSAALADVLAWIMLALVVALISAQKNWQRLIQIGVGAAVLVAVMFFLLRPLLRKLLTRYAEDSRPQGALLAMLLIGTFACAYLTGRLDVHPVFGAFLFGACLPRDDRLLEVLIERIQHVAVLALMPIFFALAGLHTTADAF